MVARAEWHLLRGNTAMGCDELRHLLSIYGEESDIVNSLVAAHIRSCPICSRGIEWLSRALISEDALSCEECRARFPTYYEATRPEYPLVDMPDVEMTQVALHLGSCAACKEQYEALVLLSQLEESGEMPGM